VSTLLIGQLLALHIAQAGILVTVAALAAAAAGLPRPWGRLAYWRCVVVLTLAIPWVALDPTRPPALPVAAVATTLEVAVVHGAEQLGLAPLRVFVSVLALGIVLRLAWLTLGYLRLRTLLASAVDVGPGSALDAMRRALAPRASIGLVAGLEQPVTFGLCRAHVLLPVNFSSFSDDEQRAVASHELLHAARGDWLSVLLEEAIRTVFWFNPGIRYALTQLQLGREEDVDAAVVALTGCRRAYMLALLRFGGCADGALDGLAFGGRRHLNLRMKALSRGGTMTKARTVMTVTGLLVCVTGATFAVAASPLRLADSKVYVPGNGVSLPTVVTQVTPDYTAAATQAKIVGTVLLDCVVRSDGKPSDISVARSLDTTYGLDSEAVKALEQWRFTPGTRNGKPVAVRIAVEMRFSLK
jgi:protein TonB